MPTLLSRSGRREVDYGEIRHGGASPKIWRAHRLALMLSTGQVDVPVDDGEAFDDWLRRVDQFYRGLEASHLCDVSLCVNPRHLSWQTHATNVIGQVQRRARRAAVDVNV